MSNDGIILDDFTDDLQPDTDYPLYQAGDAIDASLDPQAGGTVNGKTIWTPEQISAYLNRSGAGFAGGTNHAPQSDADLSVINFGFHTSQASLQANGYVYFIGAQGYGLSEYFNFAQFNEAQKAAAREAIQSWDDVIAPSLVESSINAADLAFGNLASAPTTQAYAYLPTKTLSSNPTVNAQIKDIAGDVWISASQASNFQLDEGRYGMQTLAHEIGHALGISHPGAYNAAPGLSITYAANAEYAQDTRAYSIMSYFEASSLGARHFDFHMSTTAYAGVPLIHDILAAQRIYGADMTTRTGDTVYGFNSTAGRDTFDFVKTPAPIGAIWDAGGIDTIDASGYATTQLIDLTPGSLSSIGGVTYDTAPSFEQVNANRALSGFAPVTLATYTANMAALLANPVVGRLTDNFGIAYGVTIENAIGGSGNDTIIGNAADNVLTGNAGADILTGKGGNDTLDGGSGDDVMAGGVGDDFYIVGEAGDIVIELAGEGADTVLSSISYTLGANVEDLILTGQATHGTGNELDNVITGNALSNILNGGAGNDRLIGGDGVDFLTGGAGNDVFVGEINETVKTSTKNGPISLDVITDFSAGDKIDLTGLGEFVFKGTSANKVEGDLTFKVYDSVNGAEKALGFDIDGIAGPSSYTGPVTIVFGDVDGGGADFAIALLNTRGVVESDFLLLEIDPVVATAALPNYYGAASTDYFI